MTIEQLALNFALANDEWRELKRRRAQITCQHETPRIDEDFVMHATEKPCWKWHHGTLETDEWGVSRWAQEPGYERERDDWCGSCIERDIINRNVHIAAKVRNSRLGALLRASRKVLA